MADELTAMRVISEAMEQLDIDARQRVFTWAMSKFGLSAGSTRPSAPPVSTGDEGEYGSWNIGPRAKRWLTQNQISTSILEQVFHHDGSNVEVIVAGLEGSKKDQSLTAYLLFGVAAFLAQDEPYFPDQGARDLCDRFGCYDPTNHSKVVADAGNRLSGSKSLGWRLTAPGLAVAATTIKALAKA